MSYLLYLINDVGNLIVMQKTLKVLLRRIGYLNKLNVRQAKMKAHFDRIQKFTSSISLYNHCGNIHFVIVSIDIMQQLSSTVILNLWVMTL